MYWWHCNDFYKQSYHRLKITFSLIPIIEGQLTFSSWDVIFRYHRFSHELNVKFWTLKGKSQKPCQFWRLKMVYCFLWGWPWKEIIMYRIALLWGNCFCYFGSKLGFFWKWNASCNNFWALHCEWHLHICSSLWPFTLCCYSQPF